MKTYAAAGAVLALAASLQVSAQTAGVPASINVGNGQSVATFPTGLGGLSTGSPIAFTPGAASSGTASPYYVATNEAQSSTLASLLTHYSQGISAASPTTGPPAGISTGVPGGFTGSNTVSILDGSISTIPNAATTYTGPYASSASASGSGSSSGAAGTNVGGKAASVVAMVVAVVAGGAWVL